jgi:hypothetical protein
VRAIAPARCAAPPAPAMITWRPRRRAPRAHCRAASGVRWAERTAISLATPNSSRMRGRLLHHRAVGLASHHDADARGARASPLRCSAPRRCGTARAERARPESWGALSRAGPARRSRDRAPGGLRRASRARACRSGRDSAARGAGAAMSLRHRQMASVRAMRSPRRRGGPGGIRRSRPVPSPCTARPPRTRHAPSWCAVTAWNTHHARAPFRLFEAHDPRRLPETASG